MSRPTRWGIVGAGHISGDFAIALTDLPADEHQVVAVAARQLESAEAFAKRFKIPTAYGSYDDIARDPNIDVAYIGTVHPTHAELCKQMLLGGKHVLCEKPMTMNSKEMKEVLAVAMETGKFLIEGFWSRFFPAYNRLREELAAGSVGDVRLVSVNFGADIIDRERLKTRALGGGALLDLGCYCVQFAELVFGSQMPDKISATGFLQDSGVDDTAVMTLVYPGNKMAVLTWSASCNLTNEAFVSGTKGTIKVPMMWCPNELQLPSGRVNFPLPPVDSSPYERHFPRSEGLQYEARQVRQSILQGLQESPRVTHRASATIMAIMDEARRQLGVTYDADL